MAKKIKRYGPPIKSEIPPDAAEDVQNALEGVVETAQDQAVLQADHLEIFGKTLSALRKKWVDAKVASHVEKRWTQDANQYQGEDDTARRVSTMMEAAREGFPVQGGDGSKPSRSSVVVNITRGKTNASEARLADMLLPTDDQNWAIKPTPVPELTRALASQEPLPPGPDGSKIQVPVTDAQGNGQDDGTGNPVMRDATKADHAAIVQQEALTACQAMELEIDDQLEECSYNTEARAAIHDAAVLGTGILKGPIVTNQVRRSWTKVGSAYTMELVEERKPATVHVSPWNLVPDPACGDNIHNGAGCFEWRPLSERALRALAKQPGYNKAAIAKVIEEGPKDEIARPDQHEAERRLRMGLTAQDNEHYIVWEYWGAFEPKDLLAAGVDLEGLDNLTMIDGCVVMVNDTVIKAFINPLESGDLPYDVFQWEKDDGSLWGYGVPYMMRTPQRVLNAAWRQTMDNAGLAVGPQVVLKPSQIQPADKQWEITGRKIWWCTDDSVDVRQAFQIFEFNMHVADLQALIEMALKFADEETSAPMLAQGEKGNAPETVGGMTILMNSSNVVLRRLVKQFDDSITRPHITRYYEWNMLFNPKNEIKGDFSVDARGSSALLVKDTQTQALIQLGQFMGNPTISLMVNWDEWFKETLKSNHIDTSKILKSDDEIKQALAAASQNQPQAPAVQAATVRAQSAEKIAEVNNQTQLQIERANIESQERIEASQQALQKQLDAANNQTAMAVAMINAKLQDADLQSTERQVLEKIKATLATETMKLQTQKSLALASTVVDLHKHHNPSPATAPVEEPPVQAPGRAPNGHAFQQI